FQIPSIAIYFLKAIWIPNMGRYWNMIKYTIGNSSIQYSWRLLKSRLNQLFRAFRFLESAFICSTLEYATTNSYPLSFSLHALSFALAQRHYALLTDQLNNIGSNNETIISIKSMI